MFSLEIDCDPEDRDLLIAELWEQGSAGIVELNPQTVRSFFEDDANRSALRKLFPGARQREEEARDWVQSSRDLLQPMEVGRSFFLVPEWRPPTHPSIAPLRSGHLKRLCRKCRPTAPGVAMILARPLTSLSGTGRC